MQQRGLMIAVLLVGLLAAACSAPEPTLTNDDFVNPAATSAGFAPGDEPVPIAPPTADATDSLDRELAPPPTSGGPARELLLEFHPLYAVQPLDFRPAAPPVAQAQPDNDPPAAPAPADPDPPLVTIGDDVLRATAFVDRCFRMHHEWYLMFLRELMVERMAELECAREGIAFTEEDIDTVHATVVAFLQQRARRLQMSWKQHWTQLGYDSEATYISALRIQTRRILRLERLVMLMDLRLAKVEFSWIVIRDKADRLNPDPQARAEHVVADVRAGKLTWDAAVRRHTTDARSRDHAGKFGTIVRGSLGVEDLENWLFSHATGEVSDPILHPVYGWIIARIDASTPGQPDITYAAAKETIQQRLDAQQGVPGTRVTGRDTFIWLERIIASRRYPVRSFAPRPESGEPMVAEINEQPLTLAAFVDHAFRNNPDWAQQILAEVIVYDVARREAAREGIVITPEEVAEGSARMIAWLQKSAASQNKNFDQIWQDQGYASIDEFREKVIAPLVEESLRIERLIYLQDARVERREVWHILLQSEVLAKKAKQALEEGHKFEDVAKYYSQHAASRTSGGLLGLVPASVYEEAFSKVAFSLPLNTPSDPVQTSQGWHIIRVTKIEPARPDLTWATARDEILKAIESRSPIPGQRTTAADTYRWIAEKRKQGRDVIDPHWPKKDD